MPGDQPGRVILMSTQDEHILRILGEATEPLFLAEITDRLNRELGGGAVCEIVGVYMTDFDWVNVGAGMVLFRGNSNT
jgi:hypothetical protein